MRTRLHDRIIEISKKHNLSHIGSCLTAVSIIDSIYSKMNSEDIFILSSGHAGVALYTVLEDRYNLDAEELLAKYGIHPCRNLSDRIYLSTGSLGQGVTVAVGAAIASPHKQVYCLLSDGECAEGAVWEALAYAHNKKVSNLHFYVNANGFSAYDPVDIDYLKQRLLAFHPKVNVIDTSKMDDSLPLLGTLEDHYRKL